MDRSRTPSDSEPLSSDTHNLSYGSLLSSNSSSSESTLLESGLSPKGSGSSSPKCRHSSEPDVLIDPPWRIYIREDVAEGTLHVFTTKQTGNTIFMAIALLDISPVINQKEYAILASFCAFILGSTVFGWSGNFMGHKKRGWLLLNSSISVFLLFSAAILRNFSSSAKQTADHPNLALLVIALCAMASSAQFSLAANARGLELNTSVVTGAIINQATDRRTFAKHNPPRDRRVAFWVSILSGALVGATLVKFAGATSAMAFVACCKLSIGLSFLLNPGTQSST